MNDKDKPKKAKKALNLFQICNILKLNKNTRKCLEYKYKEKEMSLEEWEKCLKKEGLIN